MLRGYAARVQSELQHLEVNSYFSNIKGSVVEMVIESYNFFHWGPKVCQKHIIIIIIIFIF